MKYGRLILIVFLFLAAMVASRSAPIPDARLLTFEDETSLLPVGSGAGRVSISDRHFREGSHSLRWDFADGAPLSLRLPVPFEEKDPTGKDTYLSTFITWVYCEEAFSQPLLFEFLKDGCVCSQFEMQMGFRGWRAAWVTFERDMDGHPEEGMDEIRITPPGRRGTIWIDHMIPATKVDSRYQSPDAQVPFVNSGTTNHWLLIWKHSLLQPDLPLESLSDAAVDDMRTIESRFRDLLYERSDFSGRRRDKLRRDFAFYDIRRTEDGTVTGRPIFMVRQAEAYERMIPDWNKNYFSSQNLDFGPFFSLMERIAAAWNDCADGREREELKEMFLLMYDYITDLGVAAGSSWGYCHHYGYNIRGIYPAYFLMRDVLRESGRLEEATRTLQWYAITNEVLVAPERDGIVIDEFNTHLVGRLASILLMDDSEEKVRYLRSFSRWIDRGCRPAAGLGGSFKVDGACFHHCNNYPAYATGGLDGAVRAIWVLSKTDFRIPEEAHGMVCRALLTMRFYCNRLQWPLSMSGRHPNGSGHLSSEQYGLMALSGSPDGSEPVDMAMAAAFLRLTPSNGDRASALEKRAASLLVSSGIRPENAPQGNLALGYGCTSVHRRGEWMALVRGHSRYLWATEQYLDANHYGRYLGYGGIEIMTAPEGEDPTLETSGWREAGFDWNRIPGATTVHLPWDRLRAQVLNVDEFSGFEEMLLSDEAFAGGLSFFGTDGNFGMALHGHDKYDGSLRARKSYHFLDSTIVCLGSGIEDCDPENSTETTIFQIACPTDADKAFWGQTVASSRIFLDRNGTGYCLSPSSAAKSVFTKGFPQETVWERKDGTSSGDWVSLHIDHGRAPRGESYEYAILPGTTLEKLKRFKERPSYRVIRQDNGAHIVSFDGGKTMSYVLFERQDHIRKGVVAAVDTSALLMTKTGAGILHLSVAQPDLALYRGPSDELFDRDGKRIERSVYSRAWINNESGEIPVKVYLKGRWEISGDPDGMAESFVKKNNTEIIFHCKDGRTIDLTLKRL